MDVVAYAASVGHSVWFSDDVGETWNRANTTTGGIYNESRCWCVSAHPAEPGRVLSGTDLGVHRWNPDAARWTHVASPMDGLHILQMAQHPDDPGFIVAGTPAYDTNDALSPPWAAPAANANARKSAAAFARRNPAPANPPVPKVAVVLLMAVSLPVAH